MEEEKICFICLCDLNGTDLNTCDTCGEFYCEDCSYSFTYHYQFMGSRCYLCADQSRRIKLDRRNSKLDYLLRKQADHSPYQGERTPKNTDYHQDAFSRQMLLVAFTNQLFKGSQPMSGLELKILKKTSSRLISKNPTILHIK